jgi:hypothetical protein
MIRIAFPRSEPAAKRNFAVHGIKAPYSFESRFIAALEALRHSKGAVFQGRRIPQASAVLGLILFWASFRYLSTGAGDTFTPRPLSRKLEALPAHSPQARVPYFGVCGWLRLTS